MITENIATKRVISGASVIAAFGLITMSSSMTSNTVMTWAESYNAYYEPSGFDAREETVSNSSLLSKEMIGDVVLVNNDISFSKSYERKHVKLRIVKTSRHISHFDFDDEYEVL